MCLARTIKRGKYFVHWKRAGRPKIQSTRVPVQRNEKELYQDSAYGSTAFLLERLADSKLPIISRDNVIRRIAESNLECTMK